MWFEPIWTHLNSADPPIFCMVKKAKDTISLWPAMGNSPRWGISPKSWSPCAAPHEHASGPVCLDVWMACTGHGTWEFYTSRLFVRFKLCKTSFNYSHNYGSSWVWNGMKWHRLGMAGRDRSVTRQFWLLFQGEHLAPCGPSRSAKQHPLQLHLSELRCLYAHTARVC